MKYLAILLLFSITNFCSSQEGQTPWLTLDSVVVRTSDTITDQFLLNFYPVIDSYGNDSLTWDDDYLWIELGDSTYFEKFSTDFYYYTGWPVDLNSKSTAKFWVSECEDGYRYPLGQCHFHPDSMYFYRYHAGILDANKMQYGNDKPVIYLYHPDSTNFTIDLDLKVTKTFTYPLENAKGNHVTWTGKVVDNQIEIDGKKYPYLFWEGESNVLPKIEDGFCISGKETVSFLEEKLTAIGLNQTEKTDFITYWAPKMIKNEFNTIHFKLEENYDEIAEINVSPAPEAMLRLYMYYTPAQEYESIPEQILSTFERKGFTLVEWGGSELPMGIKITSLTLN